MVVKRQGGFPQSKEAKQRFSPKVSYFIGSLLQVIEIPPSHFSIKLCGSTWRRVITTNYKPATSGYWNTKISPPKNKENQMPRIKLLIIRLNLIVLLGTCQKIIGTQYQTTHYVAEMVSCITL